jgi:hypothetical protein
MAVWTSDELDRIDKSEAPHLRGFAGRTNEEG